MRFNPALRGTEKNNIKLYLEFPSAVIPRNAQMSTKERKRKSTKERKRAQKSVKERKRAQNLQTTRIETTNFGNSRPSGSTKNASWGAAKNYVRSIYVRNSRVLSVRKSQCFNLSNKTGLAHHSALIRWAHNHPWIPITLGCPFSVDPEVLQV